MATVIGVSAIVVLMLMSDTAHPWMLYYYAIAMGLGTGMTLPLVAASVTDVFQGRRVGVVIGFVWLSFALGGAIGPWLAGWVFELTGSYLPAFSISLGMFVVGCIAVWTSAPRKVRDVRKSM